MPVSPLPAAPSGGFLPRGVRRTEVFFGQGDLWRRRECAVCWGHHQPFQAVRRMFILSLQPCCGSLVSFSSPTSQASQTLFLGTRAGEWEMNIFFLFFFLSPSTFLQVIGLSCLFPG